MILFQFIKIHPLETSYIKQVELFPQLSDKQLNYKYFLFSHTKKKKHNVMKERKLFLVYFHEIWKHKTKWFPYIFTSWA